jgi:uncharacterized membrane protein YebE (DUF533 family)
MSKVLFVGGLMALGAYLYFAYSNPNAAKLQVQHTAATVGTAMQVGGNGLAKAGATVNNAAK